MKTITILQAIEKWMQSEFTTSEDFADAKKGICDMEIVDPNGNELFHVQYMDSDSKPLHVDVSYHENVPTKDGKRWFRSICPVHIQTSIESFFYSCYMERMAEVEEMEAEKLEYIPADLECDPGFSSMKASYEQ